MYFLPIRRTIVGLIITPTLQEKGQYKRLGLVDLRSTSAYEIGKSILQNPENRANFDAFASYIKDSIHEGEHWVVNIV